MGPRRWWPIAAFLLAIMIAQADLTMLERCTGRWLEGGGRAGAAVRLVLAYPCSPFLLRDSALEWLLFAGMWLPFPFAVLNWRWFKRHEAYWDRTRQREKERREKKRARKAPGETDAGEQ